MSNSLATAALVAIAGAVAAPIATAEVMTFTIPLSGLQEVPPTGSLGSGSAQITIDTETRLVQVSGTLTSLIGGVTAGHLHGLAPAGTSAGVIFGFTSLPFGAPGGSFSGSSILSVAHFEGLMNGLTYVNIHTQAYPGGEVRGQIVIPPPPCPGDINEDEVVDGNDLALVLGGWGPCSGCKGDLNDDGVIDGNDLALVLGGWGPCP